MRLLAVFTLCTFIAANAPAWADFCESEPIFSVRLEDGSELGLVISVTQMRRTPKWSPGQGNPPLPISTAIDISLDWAAKRYQRFDSIKVREITIQQHGCMNREPAWYYLINFAPVIDGNELRSSRYFAAVLMDGRLIEPKLFNP